jgi:hypothetical protein
MKTKKLVEHFRCKFMHIHNEKTFQFSPPPLSLLFLGFILNLPHSSSSEGDAFLAKKVDIALKVGEQRARGEEKLKFIYSIYVLFSYAFYEIFSFFLIEYFPFFASIGSIVVLRWLEKFQLKENQRKLLSPACGNRKS